MQNGGEIKFENAVYKKVIEIAKELIKIREFREFTNSDFIEEQICSWTFNTYLEKRAKEEPINYLRRVLDENKEEHIFYFRTVGLHVEENFFVGNSKVMHINDKFINSQKEKYKNVENNCKQETLDGLSKILNNQVVFKHKTRGTSNYSHNKAKYEVRLSASVLKIFLLKEIYDPNTRLFDLEFDSYVIPYYSSFSETTSNKFDLHSNLSSNFGAKPTEFTIKRYSEIERLGFSLVSNYIKRTPKSELDFFIRELIISAGRYSSQLDPYEKNVMMIAWFERIVNIENKGRSKGLSKMKKNIIPNIVSENQINLLEKIFVSQYKIRDTYLHNGIELRFDDDIFYRFHYVAITLLKKIILLSETIKTKAELIEYFEKN
ncbi:hypothetical protein [Aquimarina macrocephali]|uniref:hypothetical protein n=1 Tax=Aquimarina macrocephali TaxID=666563 RepID=UPI00046521FC|nr:hypothetical protein [Aquimarina macrocephali]